MRKRTISTATVCAVLAGSASVLFAGAPAIANSSTTLPVASTGDIVVDGVHQRVFVSDPTNGTIVTTDYAGKILSTRGALPGVSGLALSADSAHLYAAVKGANAIVSIDPATVTETARYATGAYTEPAFVASAGGKLWFSYGRSSRAGIGSVDISAETPSVTLDPNPGTTWYNAPFLVTASGAPNMLVAGEPNSSPGMLAVYDVESGTATRTASGNTENYLRDIALTPDGSKLITSTVNNHHGIWLTSDLSKAGSYPSDYWSNAVAVAPDGAVAVGCDCGNPDISIYAPDATSPVRQFDLPGGASLSDSMLAWAPDGTRLFAVSGYYGTQRYLHVLTDPEKSAPTLALTLPGGIKRATKFTATGTVTATLPLPAGATFTVTRTDIDSPYGKSLGKVTPTAAGTFSFSDTPPDGGPVKYTVSYAGDATHTAATVSRSVTVPRNATTLKLDRNGKVYNYGTKVTFTAHLGTTYKNRTVEIYSDPYGSDQKNRLVKKGKVNSKGNLAVTLTLTRNTTVTATFTGDTRTANKSVKSTVYTRVKVSLSVSKYYKTAWIGSTKYRYFHKKVDARFTTTMTAFPGRAQGLELQYYYEGHWYSAGEQYFLLNSKGKSYVSLGAPPDMGIRLRMRASYVKGTSGDNVNATTRSGWVYLIFTK